MSEVSVSEARRNLSQLIEKVRAGEETVITSHGRPVARLVRANAPLNGPQLAAWLRRKHAAPAVARTQEQADADLAAERADW